MLLLLPTPTATPYPFLSASSFSFDLRNLDLSIYTVAPCEFPLFSLFSSGFIPVVAVFSGSRFAFAM